MKRHIAKSARCLGKRGDEYRRYVYGALRARGWKPKRERVHENEHARVRQDIDTDYAHHALRGSRNRDFKHIENRRRGVVKFSVATEGLLARADHWLNEVYGVDIVPTFPPEPLAGKLAKNLTKKVHKELQREAFSPTRNVKRALRYRRKALKIRKTNAPRAETMLRRANAVLKNRVPTLAVTGAGWVAGPGFGTGEVMAASAAKGMNRYTRMRRARFMRRK